MQRKKDEECKDYENLEAGIVQHMFSLVDKISNAECTNRIY